MLAIAVILLLAIESLADRTVRRDSLYPGIWAIRSTKDTQEKEVAAELVQEKGAWNMWPSKQSSDSLSSVSDFDRRVETPPFDLYAQAKANPDSFLKTHLKSTAKAKSISRKQIDVTIHVFAWRRVKSLVRLLTSMAEADYGHRRDIPLIFHLDYRFSTDVESVIEKFTWNFGVKTILRSNVSLGLSNMMTTAWKPSSPDSFSLFFEDDISLSPLYFTYAEWCATNLLLDSKAGGNLFRNSIGCSLYTPRINEISPTPDPQHPPAWSPNKLLGTFKNSSRDSSALFLFQLPCSWGAIYSARHWDSFIKYLAWRNSNPPYLLPAIPKSRSNFWNHSWKRYLIEYMYINSLVMVYPNFPNETSFSTNHYETGVHSVADGVAIIVPDILREDIDDRFTVPLLQRSDGENVWSAFKHAISKTSAENQLPVVDLHHNLKKGGLSELSEEVAAFNRKIAGVLPKISS